MNTALRLPLLLTLLGAPLALAAAQNLAQPASLPTITSQPTSLTVAAGSTATFTVIANGEPPLSYQWAKGGAAIASAKSATLTLTSVTANDAGSYAVTVSNLAGSVTSDVAALVVTPGLGGPPTISQQPTSQSVSIGAPVTLSVVATGQGPLTYGWYKESRLISIGNAPSFTLSAASLNDAGLYHVVITDVGGSTVSDTAALTVATPVLPPLAPPPATNPPRS